MRLRRDRLRRRAGRLLPGILVCAVLAAGCTSRSPRVAAPNASGSPAVRVASFDFPESEVLAELYGLALRARGYRVDIMLDVGPREVVDPALARGLVDLVPEYLGSSLQFLSVGRALSSSTPMQTYEAAAAAFAVRGAVALQPSPAEDVNTVVVSAGTAARYRLRTISDLAPIAATLVFGGPPECPQRPLCLPGLERQYGVRFRQFIPLDAGGPLTVQALRSEQVGVGLLFSTDPALGNGLVPLLDDRELQPADNVMPVVRAAALSRAGWGLAQAVNAVSGRLTTDELRVLVGAVAGGSSPEEVAARWLRARGLA